MNPVSRGDTISSALWNALLAEVAAKAERPIFDSALRAYLVNW